MDLKKSECDWPSDLEDIVLDPILDDPSQQLVGRRDCGYSDSRLGEPEPNLFGRWDSGTQGSPFPHSMSQTMKPRITSHEDTASLASPGGRLDGSDGSYCWRAQGCCPKTTTDLSPSVNEHGPFQTSSITNTFGEGQSQYTHLEGTEFYIQDRVRHNSIYGGYQGVFREPQPAQNMLRMNVPELECYSERGCMESHLAIKANGDTATPFPNQTSSLKTPEFDCTSFTGHDQRQILDTQHYFYNELSHQKPDSHQLWAQPECSQTPELFHSKFPQSFDSENSSFIPSQLSELGYPSYQNQDFPYETPLSQAGNVSYDYKHNATCEYESPLVGICSRRALKTDLSTGVKTKPSQTRHRLAKVEYQNMSPEKMKARQQELNKIAARAYRARNRLEFIRSKQEYEVEEERLHQLLNEKISLEAKIAALNKSFQKLSAA